MSQRIDELFHLHSFAKQRKLPSGERLIIMPGMEQMEWHQTPGNHVFDVFNTIPLIPLQSLPQVCSSQLRGHQPPVLPSQRISQIYRWTFSEKISHLFIKTSQWICVGSRPRVLSDLVKCKIINLLSYITCWQNVLIRDNT